MTGPRPRLLLGTEHPCSYLEGRQARSVFIDPQLPLDAHRYGTLLELGFRRSGGYVYRPACVACRECRPVRIRIADFRASRNQRRCLKRNAGLRLSTELKLDAEHYGLYRRYLKARHPGAGMDPEDREAFRAFLASAWGSSEILTARDDQGRLMAGGVIDHVPHGLSAVYTYFDPDAEERGLGTWMILAQVEHARRLGLDYLYLGYWIRGSAKMDYKQRFRPLEVLNDGGWERLPPAGPGFD